jgi:hypothetical protein
MGRHFPVQPERQDQQLLRQTNNGPVSQLGKQRNKQRSRRHRFAASL